jgi:hypothetical protein
MSADLQRPTENQPSMTELVRGILDDAQQLIKQQVSMVRAEIRQDLNWTKQAVTSLAIGAGVAVLGVFLLCFMLVHLIHRLAGGPDFASVPLWACFGIVGALFTAVGAVLIVLGIQKFKSFNPLPDESAKALEENVKWLKNQT